MYRYFLFTILFISTISTVFAQEKRVNLSMYDGFAIAGYVDHGGFINFTGPNINMSHGKSKFVLGMLPSLRFKEDNGTPSDAFVTPNLGIGLTYAYGIYAIQIPFYYNPKTATENGMWHVGIGIGLRINDFSKKKAVYKPVDE